MTNEELAVEIRMGRAEYGPLWEQVQGFVRLKAYKYRLMHSNLCEQAGVELDDLVQCGFFALRDAVEAFEPDRGYTLLAYMGYPLRTRFREICGINGRRRDPLNECASLEKPVGEEDHATTLGEMIQDPAAEEALERVINEEFRSQLHGTMERALNTLEDRQKRIIKGRYYDGETLADLARYVGVSTTRAQQIERQAMLSLRKSPISKLLRSFIEEMRAHYAWQGTGFCSWYNTGASSVERAAEKVEEQKQRAGL